jgi:hypothetical protein
MEMVTKPKINEFLLNLCYLGHLNKLIIYITPY